MRVVDCPSMEKICLANIVMLRDLDMAIGFRVVHAILFDFKSSVMQYLCWLKGL